MIKAVEDEKGGDSGFTALNDRVLELDPVLEIRIRQLVEREPEAAEALAAVDRARLRFVAKLYREEGGAAPGLANDLAILDYSAFLGLALLRQGVKRAEGKRLSNLLERLAAAYLERT